MASAGSMAKGQARPDDREQNAFLRDLRQFHQSRGTPFKKVPRLNGRDVNLFQLYNEVTSLGGWRKVNESQRWDIILSSLGLPKACANANLALKQFYIRYLDHYEKIHFLGEDPDDDVADTVDNPTRKSHNMTFLVPLTYNQQQHEVSETLRHQCGLSTDFVCSSDYEKVMLSLQCGLPNEVDFALNVCTLLSNEGKHTLHLGKAPRLIDFLVANTGVWTDTNISLKTMLMEKWSKCDGRHMEQFWNEMVSDISIRELYLLGQKDKENLEDYELFSFPRHLGVRESEGQRILQIATILWNLSFEECNIPVLASSPTCLKFLFLCAFCKWSCLRQIGLDTLGNIATEIKLDVVDTPNTQVMFRTISSSLVSMDRFLIIRGLEILAGLCRTEGNEDIIIRHLDKKIYEQICNLLTIHDIMLLIYTLECLYYLTELGHEICSNVACIHKIIEVLVGLITVEAQSYGSSACIAMKVIETALPVQPLAPLPTVPRPTLISTPTIAAKPASLMSTVVPGYQEADNDTFASNWLKAYYEWSPGSSVLQNDLYVDYQTICNKLSKKGLIPPSQLINLLKFRYPQIKTRTTQSQNARSEIHLEGIKRRSVPLPVSIYMPMRSNISCSASTTVSLTPVMQQSQGSSLSATTLTLSSSPILKAQLSAPPRTPSSSASAGHHPHLQQALLGKSQPSAVKPTPATPPMTTAQTIHNKDSTLIKSLLANKVNQNMLLRQQQQQLQLSPSSSNGNSSMNSELSVKASGFVSCQKTDEKNLSTKIVLPLRGSVIVPSNRSKAASPKTPIRPKSPKSRINGLPRSLNMEMCAHVEPAKDLAEPTEETNIERIENHVFHNADESIKQTEVAADEPTLDKLLRGCGSSSSSSISSGSLLQNGLRSPQNGNLSDSSKFMTMEAGRSVNLEGPPVRRKGVLADLLEGKVHKDALLSMNGIVDRSERGESATTPIILAVTNVASTSNSLPVVSAVTVLSGVTTVQTSSIITSKCVSGMTVVGSNCGSIFAVKSSPLTNGDGILTKPLKIILPLNAKDVLKPPTDGLSKESDNQKKSNVNGNSDTLQGSGEKSTTATICITPGDWSTSPSASKVIVPPRSSDSEELIGFPRVSMEQLNQLRQQAELRAARKRPSIEPATPSDGKRARVEERVTTVSNSLSTDSKRNVLTDEKYSTLPILTPSEAQQQVSAVLQGSFSEKGASQMATSTNSTRKLSVAESGSNQTKSNSKCNTTSSGGGSSSQDNLQASTEDGCSNSVPESVLTSFSKTTTTSTITSTTSTTSISSSSSSTTSSSSSSTTTSSSTSTSSSSSTKKLDYICEWKGCLRRFESPMAVFVHACKLHAPEGSPNIPCQWEGCDHMTRQRLSLMTHLQDRHCNDHMLRLQATRRQQLSQMGSSTIPPPAAPSPHPGYAPNAAVQAIRRHALEFLANKELTGGSTPAPKPRSPVATLVLPATKTVRTDTLPLSMLQDEKEGPVTKSIRLTAALILRNLVMYSSLAKSFVKRYEAHLSMVAMSNVESSRTVAQCLWELNKQQDQQIH